MEKKKNNIITIIILISILIIMILTIYKITKNHEKKLYYVMYSEIEYKAKRCYLEKKCEKEFTLKTLYDNSYLKTVYDPISKEELDSNIKIYIKKNKVIIDK